MNSDTLLEAAREVLRIESEAIATLTERLDENFAHAVHLLLECKGRVVVTGVGKSGAIGRKLASTLASTGTPALFLHAAEGLHGDLGMVTNGDVLVAISYSGRTDDLTGILPVVKDMGVPIIAFTGNETSYLAAQADVILNIAVAREACPLNLAPTASTATALAMGDALAICTMQQRGFTSENFARFHPGGALGRGLKLRVGDLMRTGNRLALVPESANVHEAMQFITAAQAGAAIVTDETGALSGYLTDGDLRRLVLRDGGAALQENVTIIMTRTPLTLHPQTPALEALRALRERGVDDAPVIEEDGQPAGVLDVQDLLRAGII